MISMHRSTSSDGGAVSTSRIMNVTLIVLLVFVIILHYVCLSVVVAKNYEMEDKFDPQHEVTEDDDDVCIFFINDDHPIGDTGACDVVIYGSGVVIITALLMMAFLVIRTGLYKKPNFLCVVDLVVTMVTGILAIVVANTATDGMTNTCDTITHNTGQSKCSDVYLYGHKKPIHAIKLYPAMVTAVVTLWIAVVIMLAITIVTVTRLLLLIARRGAVDREMVTMVKYDKLQDFDIND